MFTCPMEQCHRTYEHPIPQDIISQYVPTASQLPSDISQSTSQTHICGFVPSFEQYLGPMSWVVGGWLDLVGGWLDLVGGWLDLVGGWLDLVGGWLDLVGGGVAGVVPAT